MVDYTSNRLINFLNGWTENPVWAFLEQTRDDILNDMERQKVTIDADRLTRVALLKRAVLKRCIYGVDLNQMAVELAKVSLWLDAFTLGAPLSFLDHHLKHGNSLIGARVADVQAALEGNQTLFSQNKFAGVMLATDLMRQVSYLSDNTIEQTRQSAQAYRDARDHLAPYKRVLDVYTSRWFGNTPGTGKGGRQGFDSTVEFLRRDDTQAWLEDPRKPENRLPPDDYMQAGLVARTALQAAEEKRFFHWELEFPEVFFAPSKPGGQDVQLRKDGGFDAVVGNPPYDEIEKAVTITERQDQEQTTEYFRNVEAYEPAIGGKLNVFRLFVVRFVQFAKQSGEYGLIIPLSISTDYFCANLRKFLLYSTQVRLIDAFGERYDPKRRVFPDAKLSTAVVFGHKSRSENPRVVVKVHEANYLDKTEAEASVSPDDIQIIDPGAFSFPMVRQSTWDVMVKVHRHNAYFSEHVEIGAGEIYITPYTPFFTSDTSKREVIRGAEIGRYQVNTELSQGEKVYLNVQKAIANGMKPPSFDRRRVAIQRLTGVEDARRLNCCIIEPEQQIAHTGQYIASTTELAPEYLLSLLNSTFLDIRFRVTSGTTNVGVYELEQLPIPLIDFTTPADERERLANGITGAYSIGDNAGVLSRVQEALRANQTDVVHDVLAHLAGRMIDLNKQKQAEVGRFLGWLESKLRIQPKNDGSGSIDSLSGKTIIQGYLGDYQKGEGETSWEDFLYRLHQNRNRFAVSLSDVEGEIQIEYEKSLEALIPIKHDLARTDALIDKIVYRLYGLTDAEIELIERPQYEQALADAKAQVVGDEKIDDEEKLSQIAEGILPAAKRFFDRVEPHEVEATFDAALPHWRSLPPDAPTFLVTGDYNLRSLPDHMDFSSSVIPYTKAVEVVLDRLVFQPFRASSYTDKDCHNNFLKAFMRGEKNLTLGSTMIILGSSKEIALRSTMQYTISDVDGFVAVLTDETMREIRNKAAHDEVLSRDEAAQARAWALGILGMV